MTRPAKLRVPVGISSCLLGRRVRYDGGHKRNDPLIAMGGLVRWVPVCPEVELGLPAPRDPLRLEMSGEEVRMVALATGVDITEAMIDFAQRRVAELEPARLCGYVFKSRSPSCGLHDVPVYEASALVDPGGRGLFARALTAAWPSLPVEDEARLADPSDRAAFLERVFAYSDSLRP